MKHLLWALLCIVFPLVNLSALVIEVPGDQATVQAGINAATDGDTVLVHPGMYAENLVINGTSLVLASEYLYSNDPADIEQTVLSGNLDGSVVTLSGSYTGHVLITGFTVRNGTAEHGGGICVSPDGDCHLDIVANTFTANTALQGGALYLTGASVDVLDNTFSDNDTYEGTDSAGGAICVASGTAAVERNTFTLNIAVLYGGAICVLDSTEGVIIRNNDLRNNYSWYAGGGICCRNSLCAIVNNLFIDNQAKGPGGAAWLGEDGQYMVANNTVSENYALHGGAVAFDSGAQAEVVGNIFWADTGTTGGAEVSITDSQILFSWCDIQEGDTAFLLGNDAYYQYGDCLQEPPQFVGDGSWQLMLTSPCVNAGEPDTTGCYLPAYDLAGNPRLRSGRIDMGCYEYQSNAVHGNEAVRGSLRAWPNPFNPSTSISFSLAQPAAVRLAVYNVRGQCVRTLLHAPCEAGEHSPVWDGRDDTGRPAGSGVYFFRLQEGGAVSTTRAVMVK